MQFVVRHPSDTFALTARINDYFARCEMANKKPKPLKIVISQGTGKARSVAQNSYYHTVLVEGALEYYRQNPADFIRDVLRAIKADITHEFVHLLFKMLFRKGKSTTENDTLQAEDYHTEIREYYAREYNLQLLEPNEKSNES